MKLNPKILSIPPYISTSWKNIASLHLETQDELLLLIITLQNGTRIPVPSLSQPVIEAIFAAHAKFSEQEQPPLPTKPPVSPKLPLEALFSGSPMQILEVNLPGGKDTLPLFFEQLGSMLQHNLEQKDSPDLPTDLLTKVGEVAHNLGVEDPATLPKAEPHCNCPHCQIARALQPSAASKSVDTAEEELVTEEDLKFRSWDIAQSADKLFIVTNPLDSKEQFNVYLGDPVGCTCGEKHCEHIRAVLNS